MPRGAVAGCYSGGEPLHPHAPACGGGGQERVPSRVPWGVRWGCLELPRSRGRSTWARPHGGGGEAAWRWGRGRMAVGAPPGWDSSRRGGGSGMDTDMWGCPGPHAGAACLHSTHSHMLGPLSASPLPPLCLPSASTRHSTPRGPAGHTATPRMAKGASGVRGLWDRTKDPWGMRGSEPRGTHARRNTPTHRPHPHTAHTHTRRTHTMYGKFHGKFQWKVPCNKTFEEGAGQRRGGNSGRDTSVWGRRNPTLRGGRSGRER